VVESFFVSLKRELVHQTTYLIREEAMTDIFFYSEPIFDSSGNIFEDLDLEPAEAAILHVRAKLMNDLTEFVQSSGMTQTEAAKILGAAQSRVSDLIGG
jgi:predicted XRE-type DNA-binding protein